MFRLHCCINKRNVASPKYDKLAWITDNEALAIKHIITIAILVCHFDQSERDYMMAETGLYNESILCSTDR